VPIRYSVVVCSHNGGRTIGECLDALAAQTVPADQFEIIVVDDGSTDRLAAVVRERFANRSNGRLIQLGVNRGLSAARNAGWQAAHGEIVLYIDDDAVADLDWIACIADAYDETTAGVGGLMRPYRRDAFSPYEIGLQILTYGPHAERLRGAGGNNMSFRRSVLAAIGGFDERFVAVADDADINRRLLEAGQKLVVLPHVTVRHHLPASYRQFWRKKVGRGKGNHLFREKYGLPHGSSRNLAKMLVYALGLPIHFALGRRISRAVDERAVVRFALLSWLDRVGTAYGEFIQSRRRSV
jgi:GT2 family glycosyltransferase